MYYKEEKMTDPYHPPKSEFISAQDSFQGISEPTESAYFSAGEKIGHNFTVIKRLGEGASGTVYMVHNRLGQMEALKIASPNLFGTETSKKSFIRELDAARRLHHDHLVPIYNVEMLPETDQLFFTMELMEGNDLNTRLDDSQDGLHPKDVLKWMGQVAEALAYIHKKGLVHQDVKPANILLDQDGNAKLGDFGLAFKYMTDSVKTKLGRTSVAGGTTYFMSPEQCKTLFFGKKRDITSASDIYAFGATLYTLLTQEMMVGEREEMDEIIEDSELASHVETILNGCLRRKPSLRFPDGSALVEALKMEKPSAQTHPNTSTSVEIPKSNEPQEGDQKTVELPGTSVSLKMRWIPPGSFQMGSPDHEEEHEEDETQHEVTLTKGFWMGETQVTQAQWQAVMGSKPSEFQGENLPVETVSWDDIQAFLQKVNASNNGGSFALPTEAQWEYACRAGTTTPFHTGGNLTTDQANYNGDYPYGDHPKGIDRATTTPVRSFEPNAWGLYDMHGNVWEWCQDWYDQDYYNSSPEKDPKGPPEGSHRVERGGGWVDDVGDCRSAFRGYAAPGSRSGTVGFRLLRTNP
jgi:formylglycine-generating enzyme required for sulfatase activity